MGGSLQGRLYPRSEEERQKAIEAGYDVEKLLFQDDLCKGEQVGLHSCASSIHCWGFPYLIKDAGPGAWLSLVRF